MSNKEFWKNYQEQAWTTCMPSCNNLDYLTRGLFAEAGELCGKYAKKIRGDYDDCPEKFKQDVMAEVGDCLWFVYGLNTFYGLDSFKIPKSRAYSPEAGTDVNACRDIAHIIRCLWGAIPLGDYRPSDEIGVAIYWLNKICIDEGFTIEEAATYNLEKLAKRYKTDKIMGSGDYR